MTRNTTATDATPTRRGGARPGAGAPPGNRNAARKTAHEAALDLFAATPFRNLRRMLPPAIGELFTIALARAVEHALDEATARTVGLADEDRDQAQRHAIVLAGQIVTAAFADAWQVGRRTRDQRESAAVRALRPWLTGAPEEIAPPKQSNNQRSNPRHHPQSNTIKRTFSPLRPPLPPGRGPG